MADDLVLEYDAFLRSVKRNKDISHSFLLGAGASISSGIQSAYDCIWEWKKDIYISKKPNSSDYYKNDKTESVQDSIQNWLDNEGGYPVLHSEEEYSFYAEKAYPIADDRRKYFQNLIEGCEPYVGYKLLYLLCKHEVVRSVWTTNFDGFFVRSAHQGNLTPIEITLDNSDRIFRNQSRNEVLSIALHGDYKFQPLKNTALELDSQNEEFVKTLERYHNDKSLIVMGYSGRDQTLMSALEHTFSEKGSGRLYWCGYGHKIDDNVRSLIQIARENGREAFFVPTDGFDKTLIHLSKSCFENDPKILSIHSRRAEKEVLSMLQKHGIKNAIFHWYSGGVKLIDEIVNSGYYFSINTAMINSDSGKKIIAKIPKEHILTETDGPYIELNNRTVKPTDIPTVLNSLKDYYSMDFDQMEKQVGMNFRQLVDRIK